MEILDWIDRSVLAQVISFLGIGVFFDALFPKKHKATMVDFVTRRAPSSLSEFEASTINGLIELFSRKDNIDRLSIWRVAALSGAVLLFMSSAVWIDRGPPQEFYLYQPFLLLFFTIPFDYFSIYITKKFFFYKVYNIWSFPLRWLGDVAISLFPSVLVLILVASIVDGGINSDEELIAALVVGAIFNTISSVIISILQLSVLIAGTLARAVFWTANLVGWDLAALRNYPITTGFAVCLPPMLLL